MKIKNSRVSDCLKGSIKNREENFQYHDIMASIRVLLIFNSRLQIYRVSFLRDFIGVALEFSNTPSN